MPRKIPHGREGGGKTFGLTNFVTLANWKIDTLDKFRLVVLFHAPLFLNQKN